MTDFDKNVEQYFAAEKEIGNPKDYRNKYWMIINSPRTTSNDNICIFFDTPAVEFSGPFDLDYVVLSVDSNSSDIYVNVYIFYDSSAESYEQQHLIFRKDHECKDEEVKKSYIEWREKCEDERNERFMERLQFPMMNSEL